MSEPHRDAGTQMRRLHPSPTGPHPYPWTQPIQHQGTSIVSQAGARTRPILHMPRRPRARRLRQTQGALRKTKHNRGSLSYERIELIDMRLNPNDPKFGRGLCKQCHDVKTGRTRPAGFNQTINRNTVHHDKNSRQHPQGGGVTTTPLGPPVSCLSGAQGSNIAGGPPRGRSRRSVARAQGHDER